MRAFVPRGWSRAVLTSDNPHLKQWRRLVSAAAGAVAPGELYTGPVRLELAFHLPRPKSAPRALVYPTKKPDLDKLVRAIADSLTRVLWVDDSQVVDLIARKRYADTASPVGVMVTVSERR